MNKPTLLCGLLLTRLALAASCAAQAPAVPPTYSYAEQMPQLIGGGGAGAIQKALVQRVKVPAGTTPAQLATRILVRFVVATDGQPTEATIVQGSSPALNAAVLAAVGELPRFVPGKQNGQPVRVYETIPVQLAPAINPGLSFAADRGEPDSLKVYTYTEQMPQLPAGGGQPAIVAAVQQRLTVPAGAPSGRVFVRFTIGPSGVVYDPEIVQGLSPAANEAALAAVRRLPRLVPAQQNGRKVAFGLTVPVTFGTPTPPAKH